MKIVFYCINIIMLMLIIGKRYIDLLYILQLEKYKFKRFMGWFVDHLKDRRFLFPILLSLVQFILLAWFSDYFIILVINAIMSMLYIPFVLPKKEQKVKFVYTHRIRRLILASVIIMILFYGLTRIIVVRFYSEWQLILLWLSVIHFLQVDVLFVAFYLMQPIEKLIGLNFIKKAKIKLKEISPEVIGITGSYGKTSTKSILSHILNERFFVCSTPESYNTPFGISRTINERLRKIDQVFVCEMGATKRGDIQELVDMVHPSIGIITEIGPQHLESFQNMTQIIQTKFELIESLPKDGLAVLNYDNRFIRGYQIKNSVKVLTYGLVEEDVDYRAMNVEYGTFGSRFDVVFPNKEIHHFRTKLLGLHNIYNVLAAIVVADHYKLPIVHIQSRIEGLEPIPHRLELKVFDHYTLIDDAFNSNREGFAHALDLLNQFENKKAIITPGMIELGDKHYAINYRLASNIAPVCDLVVLVGKKQTAPIYDGLVEAGYPTKQIYVTNHFKDGFQEVLNRLQSDFTLLIENDLPDQYTEE